MGSLKKRQPKAGGKILPDTFPIANYDDKRPAFSFEHLQEEWGLPFCEISHKGALLETMFRLSRLPWKEIRKAPRHGLGTEKIEQGAIGAPIPSVVTPDTTLLAFRFFGKAPMVGFRDRDVFYVLWLDPNFKLYDHG